MTEELKVVLRRSEHSGFGFSLLGTTGPPHVIYDIVENSPAADCGAVEAGDVILKVNGTDVHRYTTKEVLKCLRLSDDLITLELKRDPQLKARIKEQLANTKSPHYAEFESPSAFYDYKSYQQRSTTSTTVATSPTTSRTSTTTNYGQSNNVSTTLSSPAVRYKFGAPTANNSHSHSHSNSSKLQIVEATTVAATSPTCKPSRIPTPLKSAAPKAGLQHSPQHKRPRQSQIPTKSAGSNNTSPVNAAYSTIAAIEAMSAAPLQHSNSYSGASSGGNAMSSSRFCQQKQQTEYEEEAATNSAPLQTNKTPRFEAYMMTGDLILNLSRTPQSSNLLPAHAKKFDSLRDSAIRARANGALAPRASGESSPTSSSSIESPTHQTVSCSDAMLKQKKAKNKNAYLQQMLQQREEQLNAANSYNSQSQQRKDSLTNDTLLLCEELEKDEEAEMAETAERQKLSSRQQQQLRQQNQQQQQQQQLAEDDDEYDYENENEEDQTHYDITNLETYNSGGGVVGIDDDDDDASDRHCLVLNYVDGDADNEEYSTNSYAQQSAKQRFKALKQRAHAGADAVDCARRMRAARAAGIAGSTPTTSSSAGTVKSDQIMCLNTSQDETSFSVPTSPISLSTPLIDKETANSVPTSPEPSSLGAVDVAAAAAAQTTAAGGSNAIVAAGVTRRHHNGVILRKCDAAGFRTSKSEDHLQLIQREGIAAVIPIDIDEDVNSSLNTLLDTRPDSDESSQASSRDRIVWTYNAPLLPHQLQQLQQQQQQQQYSTHNSTANSHSHSHSSSMSSSPQHSAGSPASPTSVSSSVMSSSGSKSTLGVGNAHSNNGSAYYQQSQQQLQQQQQQLSANAANGATTSSTGMLPTMMGGMLLSDASDSDSTILVSDAVAAQQQQQQQQHQQRQQQQQQHKLLKTTQQSSTEHKLVIQVRGVDSSNSASMRSAYSDLRDVEDDCSNDDINATIIAAGSNNNNNHNNNDARDSSPPVSDDGSDVESLHSYHYSPKAVDMPSAIRLAKRLYSLDGFKKSDVSRHLSKNNDFSRAVADEYLKYFNFEQKTLDQSLREFLQQFALSGETQERERVLVHFSKRFLDCNPGSFNSQDAVHTLTCAIMLLNTDLHGQNIGRKMSCAEFVENLAELNDGENFPKDVLKYLYQAIKSQPLEWALDEEVLAEQKQRNDGGVGGGTAGMQQIGQNPFLDMPDMTAAAVEYKKGYVMRKCCYDANYKKTPFGKRSWKMFYCTLRDLVLYLHKDEHGFRKNQMSDNLHNAVRIHHALATKATDYTKKDHVFRLQTADQSEYLFQTSDSKELQSWIETINFVCSAYSAPPLEGGVGSQKRFQRPLLPSTHTKLQMKDQLHAHEKQLAQLENLLLEHRKAALPSKGLPLQNHKEKESYLQYELRRYKEYINVLSAKLLAEQQQQLDLQQHGSSNIAEESDTFPTVGVGLRLTQPQTQSQPPQQQQQQQQQPLPTGAGVGTGNRYNYRNANVYCSDAAVAAVSAVTTAATQQSQQHQQQHYQQDLG